MKRIVVFCSVMILQGLNAFGQTNAAPPADLSIRPEGRGPKAASKVNAAGASAVAPPGALSHSSEIQPVKLTTFRRISREGALNPRRSKNDFGAKMEEVFRPQNDQMGEAGIYDPVVMIFPAGP